MDFKRLFRPGILNTRPYSPGKPIEEVQREQGLDDVVKLASNENPEGPLPEVIQAIVAASAEINRYPDASSYSLTRAIARQLDVPPEALILGNGSNEVIDILMRALISPGENVVYADPSFIVYPLTAGVHFECGRAIPLDDEDRHDLPAMARAADQKTKLLIVCNPNNPTGTYNTGQELEALLDALPPQVIVAVDEAYYEYVTAPDYPQTLSLQARYPNLFVLRTFSKVHSLAGLRIGYGVGHPDLVGELQKTREPFNVSSIAQAAAMGCLENMDAIPGRVRRNRENLERLARELMALGLRVTPSQTNFLLVRLDGDAAALAQKLQAHGVIVRPGKAFGMPNDALRISVGLPAENERCVNALKEILGEA